MIKAKTQLASIKDRNRVAIEAFFNLAQKWQIKGVEKQEETTRHAV
jgi:hypothetical protein